jgi:hypothetical protein
MFESGQEVIGVMAKDRAILECIREMRKEMAASVYILVKRSKKRK